MTCEDIDPKDLEVNCPACKKPVASSLFFSPDERQAKGRQLSCPSCGQVFWLNVNGTITAASGCGEEILELVRDPL